MDDNPGTTQAPASASPERAPFRAVLTSHRSLGPRGFLLLMTGLSLVSFATGIVFLIKGAWPVIGFLGLDVGLIYVAFKLNYRSGRLHETIELDPDRLVITRFHPSGHAERFEFNPYWLRVQLEEGRDGRTALSLRQHARAFPFARFLTDDERRAFAATLGDALRLARRGFR